jgi:hypothetical protein
MLSKILLEKVMRKDIGKQRLTLAITEKKPFVRK